MSLFLFIKDEGRSPAGEFSGENTFNKYGLKWVFPFFYKRCALEINCLNRGNKK